jgi:hypothetical protein
VPDDRERAWSDIHDLLPPGWRVPTAALHDPATGRWHVTAVGPNPGGRHRPPPKHLTGEGLEEETALVDLMLKLRELDKADHLEAVWRRVRLAYYQGAEEQSRRVTERPLTADELERVVERFPRV